MYQTILHKLPVLEQQQNIKLLYVAESGSRAWGFASTDSDYDVRGIFIHPYPEYFAIDNPKESFERIEDQWFDVGGWELRKALRLLRKSNSTLLEWLQSPIIYHQQDTIRAELLTLAQRYYQPSTAIYHYRGIAKSAEKSLTLPQIRLKKWFYVLRPLLAAYWCASQQTIPPMTIDALLAPLPTAIQQEVHDLIAFKASKDEHYLWTPTTTLQQCIDWLWQQSDITPAKREVPDSEALNQWFRKILRLKLY